MPVVATENFVGTADVTLQGKTTATGGLTWAASGSFVPDEQGLKLSGSGVGKNSSTNGCLAYVNAGAADSYAQARFLDGFTTNQGISVAVACVDLNNWIALCTFVAGQVRLLKRVSGTLTAVATITGLTLTSGDTFRIERVGTTVKIFQNGVQLGLTAGYTVADAVFTGVTNVGLWAKAVSSSLVDDFEAGTMAAGGTLTIGSGPMANQVYQRAPGGTSKAVSLSGSYTGADPANIQAQIETVGGTVLSAWATLSGLTIGSGSWSGASVTVPQRSEWLVIKLRSRDSGGATLATAQTGQFGVGVHVHIDGQSNGLGMSSVSGGTATTASVAEWTGSAWTTASGMGGAGERAFGQELATLLGVAVGFSNSSVGATAIDQHKPPSGSQWTDTAAMIAAVGGDAEIVLWCQGESNAGTTDVSASYSTSLQDIANGLLTLTGRTSSQFRMFVSVTGRNEGSTQGNSIGWQSVRIGQVNAAAAHAAIDISHDCIDFAMSDGVHYAAAGQTEHGYRFARSVAKWLGSSAYDGRGPRVASASISGSTVTVTFDLNGAASLTGAGTLTGWEFFNGGTWAAATDATRVGNTVTFTGSGATAVRHLYGQDPDVSNLARGNLTPSASSSVGLPVEPTRADVAVTGPSAVTLGAGQDATATADAGGSALFAYTLGAGADAVVTADAGGGIASGLLLGAGADASATADAGGSALFAYSLGGAADAVRLVDAGGAIGDGSTIWPATRAGEAATARVPFDGVRVIVPDSDDAAAPVNVIPLYVADTERLLIDWEAKYLPGAGDTAATLVALDAPAGVSVTPSVAPGAALTTGVVVLAVTPTGAAGTYRVALRISTAGGRESTALVDVVVSATVQSAKTFRLRSTADRDVFDLDFAAKYLAGAADVADVLLSTSADAGLTADARLDVGGVVQVAVDNPDAPGTYQVRTQLQTAAGRRKTGAIDVEVLA